ncbi:nucleotidyltransferase family protein [Actinomycetes bacterium KLBMP 9797]
MTDVERLRALIRSSSWHVWVLGIVRAARLPDAWVGAGAIRDLVWGELYGSGFHPSQVRDLDVAFFDPSDLSRDRDDSATRQLAAGAPDVPWEATNQAAVHTWYEATFGEPAAPLHSVADAIATWPETATAVGVRLGAGDEIEVCAPLGLGDLLSGVWRHNPRRISVERSLERLARHRPAERWPGVHVIPPSP